MSSAELCPPSVPTLTPEQLRASRSLALRDASRRAEFAVGLLRRAAHAIDHEIPCEALLSQASEAVYEISRAIDGSRPVRCDECRCADAGITTTGEEVPTAAQ